MHVRELNRDQIFRACLSPASLKSETLTVYLRKVKEDGMTKMLCLCWHASLSPWVDDKTTHLW
jgi:hypothetical protein